MEAAETIRNAVWQVSQLRQDRSDCPALGAAVAEVKGFQTRRFASTYADLIAGTEYRAATRFFLEELYGEADFDQRDAQFARIAGALQRMLPATAVATAVMLAQLHALSERLDHVMGQAWLKGPGAGAGATARYIRAWRTVGCREERDRQLRVALAIGADLDRLTRTPGLRVLLKSMHGPANAAGLGALQQFLESGFDTFAAMGKRKNGARDFLAIVQERESRLIGLMFDADFDRCRAQIDTCLMRGP